MTYIHQYYTTILILLCYPAITSTAYHSGHAITTVTVVSNQGIDTACAAILTTGLVKTWGTGGGLALATNCGMSQTLPWRTVASSPCVLCMLNLGMFWRVFLFVGCSLASRSQSFWTAGHSNNCWKVFFLEVCMGWRAVANLCWTAGPLMICLASFCSSAGPRCGRSHDPVGPGVGGGTGGGN